VKDVIQISSGVAVVADNTWTAFQGKKALNVTWDEGPNLGASSESIFKAFEERAEKPGVVSRKEGDAPSAMAARLRRSKPFTVFRMRPMPRWSP